MRTAFLLALLTSALATADANSWRVPDGAKLSTSKCDGGDMTECLHLGWNAEAGGGEAEESPYKRLTHAYYWFVQACTIGKQASCPNADRVKSKIDKVDAMKEQRDKDLFYCGDAMDSAKLRVAGNKSQGHVMMRNCLHLMPSTFRGRLGGMAKMSTAQRQEHVLQAGLDDLCPTLAKKPPACSLKAKGLATAKQEKASAEILGAAFGGELSKRGVQINGFLLAN